MATSLNDRAMSSALADYVTSTEFRAALTTKSVRSQTKRVLLDTVAVIAAAGRPDDFRAVTDRWLAGDGKSTRLVDGAAVPALAAAVANGAAANATLLAEGHRMAGGHPAAHVVPAVLAVSEDADLHGAQLLDGIATGYEVAVQVARAIGTMRAGISPNGNWGTIGAAAGVAYALSGGDPSAVAAAIGAAAEVALYGPMRTAHDGSASYRWFVGLGAGAALLCGASATLGWSSGNSSFSGWYLGLSREPGTGDENPRFKTSPPGSEPEIMHNYFKRFGGCAHTLSSIDAMLEIGRKAGPSAWKGISTVDIRCASPAAVELDECCPGNLFGARYSIPTLCAVALRRGADAVADLTEDALSDPDVQDLARRIGLHGDAALATKYPGTRAVQAKAVFDSGETIEAEVTLPLGDYERPLSDAELQAKARHLLSRRLDGEGVDRVSQAIASLDEAPSSVLSAALRA